MCEGGVYLLISSPRPLRSGFSANCLPALTLNLPTCCHAAVLQRKQCVSLSAGHLRYFQRRWEILEQTRCQLEKKKKINKVPSEVKKHSCSVVKLVYSIKPGSQAQLQQILLDEDRTT